MANSPARAAVDVGSVIADTYTIEALLGRGGMGAVFLASHRRLAGKRVAIKILHTEIEDQEVVARFRREAEIAARLNHPNIVGVIDYNVSLDGMPYLVLDYLEGETLAQRIARGPLPLEQVVSIVRQVGSALAAAHRAGIVHRDLKPQNIFLVPTEVDGRQLEIAKVLDFGISKIRGSQTVKTQDSALLGTPQYMAPEQATGQHASIDERTDVFAFGAIVYEMLCGQAAFAGDSLPAVVFKVVYEQPLPLTQQAPGVPPAIAAAVSRAMAKPSDDRFPNVAGFVEAITGQPLSVSRDIAAAWPVEGPPSAVRRTGGGGDDAYARTMGPAAAGPVDPLLATAAPGALNPGYPPGHQTYPAPAAAQPHLLPPSTAPGTTGAALPGATVGPAGSRGKRTGLLVSITIAAAAAAAAVVYVTRSPQSDGPRVAVAGPGDREPADSRPGGPPLVAPGAPDVKAPDVKPPDIKAPDVKPPDVQAPDVRPPDTTSPQAPDVKPPDVQAPDVRPPDTTPAKLPGHRPTNPRPTGSASPRPQPVNGSSAKAGGDDDTEDEDARDKLKQATAAVGRGDHAAAERLANTIINNAEAGPRQRAAARLIHGTIQCVAHNDQEGAQIDLRHLAGFPQLRRKLIAACKRRGIELTR